MGKLRILIIDDDEEFCQSVKEFLENGVQTLDDSIVLSVTYVTEFEDGIELLDERRLDLVILDLRVHLAGGEQDLEAGIRILRTIQDTRFVPIIFYTGLPNLVQEYERSPIIQVLRKELGPTQDGLLPCVETVTRSLLPKINRALTEQVAKIQRDYMWDFVSRHWDEVSGNDGDNSLFYLVARRLALSLSAMNINQFVDHALGAEPAASSDNSEEMVPPERYYIMPPLGLSPLAGDIYLHTITEVTDASEDDEWKNIPTVHRRKRYWIVLTPSCDLVHTRVKAERVLLAKCYLFEGIDEYRKWKSGTSKTNTETLENLLRNTPKGRQQGRYLYLPGALELPDLLVDFQEIMSISYSELKQWERVASLDSPFAEAVLTGFTRFFGRLGTPNLDISIVLSRLGRLQLQTDTDATNSENDK